MTEQPQVSTQIAPPDSQVSLNWQMTDGYGATVQVTMRCAMLEDWPSVMKTRAAFCDLAQKNGWTFPTPPIKPAPGLHQPAAPSNGKQPAPVAVAQVGGAPVYEQQELTFPAGLLSCTLTDGKPYWKVKGGRFEKFGVTVWPETLDAAGLKVKPGEAYNLAGWTAHYVTKADGKPEKIVKLTAPATEAEPF